MDEKEYYRFVEALNQGERVVLRDFEEDICSKDAFPWKS